MHSFYRHYIWWIVAGGCFTLVLASFILTHLLQLHPCYLCVFQRFLYLLITSVAIIVAWSHQRIVIISGGILIILFAMSGASVAGYQVWLQTRPGAEFACSGGNPNIIEKFMIELDRWIPVIFQATGNCASQELTIFGLSLASWSFVCFIISLLIAIWGLRNESRLKV